MNLLNRLADQTLNLGDGALYSIICVLVVFTVLIIIILASYGCSKLVDYIETKNKTTEEVKPQVTTNEVKNTNITDEDMMAAVLVATIDYRNEVKKDVRLVSVKEVK